MRERVRLAELVALLSLGTDLGLGQPMEHMIRACLIALRLGERMGLADLRDPIQDHRKPIFTREAKRTVRNLERLGGDHSG